MATEPTTAEMQLNSMPASIQIKILEYLNWPDTLQARLVCRNWCTFVNYFEHPTFKLTDKIKPPKWGHNAETVLPCLIKSFYAYIGVLKVRQLETALPIMSSRRLQLLQAQELVLCAGNSTDNILKLLRYYVRYCQVLWLKGYSLANLRKWQLKTGVCVNRLTEIKIKFRLPPLKNVLLFVFKKDASRLRKHLVALGGLLTAVHFPSLRSLQLHILAHPFLRLPETQQRVVAILANFATDFGKFLKSHNSTLLNLDVDMPCADLLNEFKHLDRVENLILTYHKDCAGAFNFNGVPFNSFRTDPRLGFANFKNLISLDLVSFIYQPISLHGVALEEESIGHCNVMELLLANNKNTLQELAYVCYPCSQSLNWLYAHPGLKLTYLVLNVEFQAPIFNIGWDYKFEHLIECKLCVDALKPGSTNWCPTVCNWISHTMSALEFLTLDFVSDSPAEEIGIRVLVDHLPKLRDIEVGAYADEIEPISPELLAWIAGEGEHQVRGEPKDDEEGRKVYKISIQRPLNKS